MSHGTFLELLDIAARERGLRAEITLFPQGPFGPDKLDLRPVARIRLAPDPAIQKDPLFAQILAEAVKPNPMRFGFVGTDQPDVLTQHRAIAPSRRTPGASN